MAQIEIGTLKFNRTRTRTYDAENDPNYLLTAMLELLVPVGGLVPTLASQEPGQGWKICNGQALLKSAYPRLYSVIGGAFGEDAETFFLPDLRGRMPIGASGSIGLLTTGGAESVTLSISQLPSHGHSVNDPGHGHGFTGTPHSHSITDPGHTHDATSQVTATAGPDTVGAISGATASATTGITIDPTTAEGTVASAASGITINNTGSGNAVPTLPPYMAMNWMVRT